MHGSERFSQIMVLRTSPKVTHRLICFAHAGAGASFFKPWANSLEDHIELCAVQLPGRENFYSQPLITSFEDVMDLILPGLLRLSDLPYAFFGHSFGGLLAFEATCRLAAHTSTPKILAVSAVRAAHLPDTRKLASLPDAELLESISDLGGSPASAMKNPELMQIALPILRADFACIESYTRPPENVRITPAIWACGGAADPWVNTQSLGAWSRHAGGDFKLRLYPGGHFYVTEHGPSLAADISLMLS